MTHNLIMSKYTSECIKLHIFLQEHAPKPPNEVTQNMGGKNSKGTVKIWDIKFIN